MPAITPSSRSKHAISVSLASNQAIASTLTFTKINLSRVDVIRGPAELWDSTTKSVVVQRSGVYLIMSQVTWLENNLEIQGFTINDGTTDLIYQAQYVASAAADVNIPLHTLAVRQLDAGTSIFLRVRQQNSTSAAKTAIGSSNMVTYLSVLEM